MSSGKRANTSGRRKFLGSLTAAAGFAAARRMGAAGASAAPSLPATALTSATATPTAKSRPSSATSSSALQTFLTEQAEHFGIPGMSVAVSIGSSAMTYHTGKASLEFGVDVDDRTLFHIGSNGKLFTAIAILQLAQAKRVDLGDSILKHVPEAPAQWRDRTLIHLLHHTSGIPDYLQDFDWSKAHTRSDVCSAALKSPLRFEAGAGWSYSNTNYMLLGYAIENVTGASYGNYITDNLLRPAGIETSRIDAASEIIARRAEGYTRETGHLTRAPAMENAASGWPDGGLLFCAGEWPRWTRAVESGLLISAENLRILRTPAHLTTGRVAPYGCAVFTEMMGAAPYYWHTGGVPGFTSFTLDVPSRELSVLLATNVEVGSSRPHRYLGQRVAEALSPGSTALSLSVLRDRDPALTRTLHDLLLRGEQPAAADLFAPEIRQQMNPKDHRAPIPTFEQNVRDVALVEMRRTRTETFRRYRFTYSDRVEHVSVGTTPENLIHWLFWL